ncbi:MAG: dihydroorotate dehydrogenase electron transfer subunit [Candidatus Atribacteria bacterium]|nr:dihydroorotate dehydrogenase electron transfer subunit [Candidatus Atribacteria bacterium]
MAIISFNQPLKNDFFLLKISGKYKADMGQFFMIRKDSQSMFLNRPMSVYDIKKDGIIFLYQVVGKGTSVLASCKKGDEISIYGPYGHGFPLNVKGSIALVGGGTGIAPLFYALKQLRKNKKLKFIHVYLGLQKKNEFESNFNDYTDSLIVHYGGFITDYIQYEKYNVIFSCGPLKMLEKIDRQAKNHGIEHYVSLEGRMACGIGACLACAIQTKNGNKHICKDGPVFKGEEIFYYE